MQKTYVYSSVLQDVAEILGGKWTRTLHVRSLVNNEEYWFWDGDLETYDVDYLEDESHVGLKLLEYQGTVRNKWYREEESNV